MSGKTIEEKRAELARARAENEAAEKAIEEADELAKLDRELAILEKRKEARAHGLKPVQLVEIEWPGIGPCLFRTPQDVVYRDWAKRSGVLKGELSDNIDVHAALAKECVLVPPWDEFKKAYLERCPHAPAQIAGKLIERMQGKLNEEKK